MSNLGIRHTGPDGGLLNTLRLSLRGHESLSEHCPEHAFGIWGLVADQDRYHLLSEDDGHYHTRVVLEEGELLQLRAFISALNSTLSPKRKRWKLPESFRMAEVYNLQVTPQKKAAPLLGMTIKGERFSFSLWWIPALHKTLNF